MQTKSREEISIDSRKVMCQVALPSYANGATVVQPWCNLSRNYRNNRHNRTFWPCFCHCVDIIDTI